MITYHSRNDGDPFRIPEAVTRANYYGVSGYPTVRIDGIVSIVGGYASPGTVYPDYRDRFSQRIEISSPLEITLTCTYDSVANTGTVNATVLNTSGSPVSGNLHFALIEDHVPFNWDGGLTECRFMMRDMLPDAAGEAVTVPTSDTIMRSRNFTVDGAWDEKNCRIAVFVQNNSTKEIYQGAEIGIIPIPVMNYFGSQAIETSGNGNGIAEPGESMELKIAAKNMGTGNYTGTANVQCAAPYITITGATPASVSIGPGDVDTVTRIQFDIDAGCPNPALTFFEIDFGSPIDSIPFVITTTPGIADNIESGQGDWTLFGPRNNWHITTHKSNSPTHSWYCGLENSWLYTIYNDASLATPYFAVLPESALYFHQQYKMQTNADLGYIEVDNGSGWWQTIDVITGTLADWTETSYPLDAYPYQTIRMRFRFLSDNATNQEGWYIDDISTGHAIGITENLNRNPVILGLDIYPNPFAQSTRITYLVATDYKAPVKISIYDATGRIVKHLSQVPVKQNNQVLWSGDDDFGFAMPAGIYFIKLEAGEQTLIKKAILLR